MEFLSAIDYRDPLFSIIALIFCIGIISLIAYYWDYFINKKQQDSLRHFIESFDYMGIDKETREFLALSQNPVPSVLFIAKMYQKSANHEKAIRLYITLLDYLKSPSEKIPILELLGDTYYKAGFPLRAKEIFLEILHHYPRHIVILKQLIKIYEELGEYKQALEALDCLEEIQGGMEKEKAYLESKLLITSTKSQDKKLKKLLVFMETNPQLSRVILGYLKSFHPFIFWERLEQFSPQEILNVLDILWNIPKEEVQNKYFQSKILCDIFQAKGYLPLSEDAKSTFELESLCLLLKNNNFKGDLKFQYHCLSCQGNTPLAFERCPYCGELLHLQIHPILKEKQNETHYSFL